MRYAAITGVGLVTPLGVGREATWSALRAGRSGVGRLPYEGGRWCGGAVPQFFPSDWRCTERSIAFALCAADEAVGDAQLDLSRLRTDRAAAILSSSKGGLVSFARHHERFLQTRSADSLAGFWDDLSSSSPALAVAARFGIEGPALSLAAACASGAHAVVEATDLIREDRVDVVLAGATEASLHPLVLAGFDNLGVLAKADGDPVSCCKPFDRRRTGFAPAEGCCVMVIEEAEHARRRGAPAYARVAGGARGCDASHIAHFDGSGSAIASTLRTALCRTGIQPDEIGYVNAHGTGTRLNDLAETRAIKAALGDAAYRVPISSTKSAMGHLLGAAGAVEVAVCALAIRDGFIPPTLHLEEPDDECDLDYVPRRGRAARVGCAVSLSFGFGGQIGIAAVTAW